MVLLVPGSVDGLFIEPSSRSNLLGIEHRGGGREEKSVLAPLCNRKVSLLVTPVCHFSHLPQGLCLAASETRDTAQFNTEASGPLFIRPYFSLWLPKLDQHF